MIPLKDLLSQYFQNHWALPAFNCDSFEIYQAAELAVKETGLPCIVQLSPHEDTFLEAERLLMLVKKANHDGLPIYLNLDHGNNIPRLFRMAALGYDMVHYDGSLTDYPLNLAVTKDFAGRVKSVRPDLLIEAEFNHINLVEASVDPSSFTQPVQAKEFIEATGADLLAVSIGNLHGVNVNLPEHINISLLSEIRSALPSTFFTLHGGSGIDPEQIKLALGLGIVKININTDLRLKFHASLQNQLAINHSEKIYDYLAPVITDVKNLMIEKLKFFTHNV